MSKKSKNSRRDENYTRFQVRIPSVFIDEIDKFRGKHKGLSRNRLITFATLACVENPALLSAGISRLQDFEREKLTQTQVDNDAAPKGEV